MIADLDGTTLSFEGKHLEFPVHALEELEVIIEGGPFAAADFLANSTARAGSCSSGG